MFTRIHNDDCSIGDRDDRNQTQYKWLISSLPSYRRGQPLESQYYSNYNGGIERNWKLDSRLRGLDRVLNECDRYEYGVQEDILASAESAPIICAGNALAPTYSRTNKVARHIDTYESNRANVVDWHFYTPPVPWPTYGVYEVNRNSDTRQNSKDSLEARNKKMLNTIYRGH